MPIDFGILRSEIEHAARLASSVRERAEDSFADRKPFTADELAETVTLHRLLERVVRALGEGLR